MCKLTQLTDMRIANETFINCKFIYTLMHMSDKAEVLSLWLAEI